MNELVISGTELRKRFGPKAILADVFKEIEGDLRQMGEVVCQFKINGLKLDEEAEVRLAQSTLEEVDIMNVMSQKPVEILKGVVDNWNKKIPEMMKTNDQLAENIRHQGIEGHLKTLVDLVDDARLLVDSLISIDQVFPQLPMTRSQDWRQTQVQMANTVGEVLDAFQKKDYTVLADILEYDMGHLFQIWIDRLGQLVIEAEAPERVNGSNISSGAGSQK